MELILGHQDHLIQIIEPPKGMVKRQTAASTSLGAVNYKKSRRPNSFKKFLQP